METPVIIPALNEENNIGRLLRNLPKDVAPIVVVNGSTDHTAEIAESFGVKLFNLTEQGKLPAIQHALRFLGKRALDPLIILDADSTPIFPKAWHNQMLSSLEPESRHCIAVSGPVWSTPNMNSLDCHIDSAARSLYRIASVITKRHKSVHSGVGGSQYGPNQGYHMQNYSTLEQVLDLDHYWPREDLATVKTIVGSDKNGVFKQIASPLCLVLAPNSESYQPIVNRFKYGFLGKNLKRGTEESHSAELEDYLSRGAPGSKLYDEV